MRLHALVNASAHVGLYGLSQVYDFNVRIQGLVEAEHAILQLLFFPKGGNVYIAYHLPVLFYPDGQRVSYIGDVHPDDFPIVCSFGRQGNVVSFHSVFRLVALV